MKTTLYVVNGPSGAGKSHLLRYVETRFDGARAIPKLTTRPQRAGEAAVAWSDLIHVSDERFRELDPEFRYTWNGYHYGIGRAELTRRLDGARLGVIVVRNSRTIRELAMDLSGCDVVAVLVTASPSTRRKRLIAEGLDATEISRRLAQDRDPAGNDRPDTGLYQWHLENESSPEDFHRKISQMIAGVSDDRVEPG
jgi:ribose 1,5-bisphosphokinase PhnN